MTNQLPTNNTYEKTHNIFVEKYICFKHFAQPSLALAMFCKRSITMHTLKL